MHKTHASRWPLSKGGPRVGWRRDLSQHRRCHDTVSSEFLTKIINLKDGSERFGEEEYKEEQQSPKKKSRCDHGQPMETSWRNTKQQNCCYRRHTLVTGNEPSTRTNSMNRRDFLMRSGEATPRRNVSRRSMSSSLPALAAVPSDRFNDTIAITNPTTMQVESAGRAQHHAEDALYGPGGYEHIILRMETQECSIRNIISEELARCEHEEMERDARFSVFHQDLHFKIAVREQQRQARVAVNQAVRGIFRKLRSCDDARISFKIFKIDMKDDWKKMKEGWHE